MTYLLDGRPFFIYNVMRRKFFLLYCFKGVKHILFNKTNINYDRSKDYD